MRLGGVISFDLMSIIDSYFDEVEEQESPDASGEELLQQIQEDNNIPQTEQVVDNAIEAQTQQPEEAEQQSDDSRIAGKGGDERGFGDLEGIADLAKDAIGALLPSMGIADKAAELYENVTGQDTDSTLDVVSGATVGAVETTLEAGEVIGDTVKSLVDWKGMSEAGENPFDMDTYNWASWNLGRDDFGSKTGHGKIAQGFLEFGLMMGATGGMGGGAQAVTGTTRAARLASAAKGAGKDVLRGVAADMVSAASGEGNLTNLIKEHAPDLLPTWMTALAIDEDDNPWEAALKTTLEGGFLGGALGTVTAYLGGARAAKKAKAEGKSPVEVEEAAVQGAQAKINEKPADVVDPDPSPVAAQAEPGPALKNAVQQALDNGNPERFERLSALLDQKSAGIPYYWDDVAASYKEYYQAGPRDLSQGIGRQINDLAESVGGLNMGGQVHIVDPLQGAPAAIGDFVPIDNAKVMEWSQDKADAFLSQNREVLSRDDAYLRISRNEKTGGATVELVRLIPDPKEAEILTDVFDKSAYYRNDGSVVPRPGRNRLDGTEGAHLKSPINKPQEVVPVAPEKAIAQQVKAENSPTTIRGGAERAITNNQIKRLADSPEAEGVLKEMVENFKIDGKKLSELSGMSEVDLYNRGQTLMNDLTRMGVENVDVKAIPTTKVDGMDLLTFDGVVATRGMISELLNGIMDNAANYARVAEVGGDNIQQVKLMRDKLVSLMEIHKVTANHISNRLRKPYSSEVPTVNGEFKADIEIPRADNARMTNEINDLRDTLDEIIDGLEKGTPGAKQKSLKLATALQLAGGEAGRTMDIGKSIRKVITSKGLSLMYNSMLSSPTTHLVNGLSNALNVFYRPLAAYAGGNAKARKEAIASFYSFGSTLKDSWEIASRTLQAGNTAKVQGSKVLQEMSDIDVTLKTLQQSAEASDDIGFKMAVGFADTLHNIAKFPLFDWPSNLLTTSDEFFKAMVTRMEYNRKMMGKAVDMAGTDGKGVDAAFESLLKDEYSRHFTSKGEVLDEGLLNTAKEVTMQTDLEGAIGGFQAFINDHAPALRIFFPFVKTGHNIMVYTASHVPILNSRLKEYKQVMAGTDEYAKAVMKGRVAVGTTLMLTAGLAYHNDMFTGNGPSDPKRRKEWLKSHQPRSLKVGNYWVSYDRIEPFGQILAAVADVAEGFTSGQLEEDKARYLTGYITYAIAMNLTNKSYMQGLVPLGQILSPGWSGISQLEGLVPAQINNFLPLSGARRALSNAMTQDFQEFNSVFDRAMSQVAPGLGNKATAHDILNAEAIPNPSGGINAFLPFKIVPRGQDVVRDALEDVEFDSSVIAKTIKGIKLEPKHTSRLQQLMGESNLYNDLKKWVTHPSFKPAVEEYYSQLKEGGRVPKESTRFYSGIQKIIRSHRDDAIQILRHEFPELSADIDAFAAEKMDTYVSDLTDFPLQ